MGLLVPPSADTSVISYQVAATQREECSGAAAGRGDSPQSSTGSRYSPGASDYPLVQGSAAAAAHEHHLRLDHPQRHQPSYHHPQVGHPAVLAAPIHTGRMPSAFGVIESGEVIVDSLVTLCS